MDLLLIAIAVGSLLAAAGAAAAAWHVLRRERLRSEARVSALSAAIDEMEPQPEGGEPRPAVNSDLFVIERSAAARGYPGVRLAAGVLMSFILVVAATTGRGGRGGDAPTPAAATAPLELISMRHSRDGDSLVVSGLVRNPRTAAAVSRVTAVVLAFDRAGAFAAAGRAALDFTTLAPGDESPFVVRVTGPVDIGKYRVSFRTDFGVVRHLDRRAEAARLASATPAR